jgi:hypothetical protein
MIGRNVNTPADSRQFCAEKIGIAVLEILKQYGEVNVRQISETELYFVPKNGKHLQITDENDQLFLFALDFNWHQKMCCYILKT